MGRGAEKSRVDGHGSGSGEEPRVEQCDGGEDAREGGG